MDFWSQNLFLFAIMDAVFMSGLIEFLPNAFTDFCSNLLCGRARCYHSANKTHVTRDFFTNSPQYKNANIANFVLSCSITKELYQLSLQP